MKNIIGLFVFFLVFLLVGLSTAGEKPGKIRETRQAFTVGKPVGQVKKDKLADFKQIGFAERKFDRKSKIEKPVSGIKKGIGEGK